MSGNSHIRLIVTLTIACVAHTNLFAGELTSRAPLPKPSAITKPAHDSRLTVKFHDDWKVRVVAGDLTSLAGADLRGIKAVREEFSLTFDSMIKVPVETLEFLESRAAQKSGMAQPDLVAMMEIGGPEEKLEAAAQALLVLDETEWVYFAMLNPEPPCVDIPPTTPDYFVAGHQGYHEPNPGLDMTCAWMYNARGQGIQIADCEYGYILGTEDLCDINNEPGQTFFAWLDHGTAVLGEMVSLDNTYGCTGLVPDATAWFFTERSEEEGFRRIAAITNAIATVDPGDVVLLEMQTFGPGGNYAPAELDPAVWTLTRNATDSDIIIVAAAGNGDQDLDSPAYEEYRNRGDSGAIIVGAGSSDTNHDKMWFSTYGQRVNVHGWGENVFTLGIGDYAEHGGDERQRYTDTFNGTSSASPFIASCVASLQSLAEAESGSRLTPSEMRQLLIDTGIPQGSGGHIGPFPNMAAAIDGLEVVADCNGNNVPDECEVLPTGTLYVDGDAVGLNDGSSWDDAYLELYDALSHASCAGGTITEIRVAEGTYTPDPPGAPADPREATFQLLSGVAVYGGFAGYGAPDPNERDVELYETVLSGDLTGDDGAVAAPEDLLDEPTRAENSYHVVTGSGTNDTAVLDGVSVRDGNANAIGFTEDGGGMFNQQGSPTVANCTFSSNTAYDHGGAMFTNGGNPTVTNCTFRWNAAGWAGGALADWQNCSSTVANCTFSGNWASGAGGGIFHYSSVDPTMTNCTFTGNSGYMGSAMFLFAATEGATVTNCIIWDNVPSPYPPLVDEMMFGTVRYNDIEGGYPVGEGNIDADPLFVDVDGPDDVFGTADDDLHLLLGSPCINAGDDDAVPPGVTTDFEGDDRIQQCRVDMGVDETPYIGEDCNDNGVADACAGQGTTVTYDILEADLLNLPNSCGATPESKYGWRTQAGFQWPDTGSENVSEVLIEFNVGVECHTEGTIRDTSLNGVPDASYESTEPHCSCLHTEGTPVAIDADPSSYNLGGSNTFLITTSTMHFGFIPQDAWGSGVYARVTVLYGEVDDCNANGVPDDCDITAGTSEDCNENRMPDECDIAGGTSEDCNTNDIPDECEVPPIDPGAPDCNENLIPDECETDCQPNGVPDDCDIAEATSEDCNENGTPDECEVPPIDPGAPDCNENLIPDECETDCQPNGVPDDCDIAEATSEDCNGNGIPDECLDSGTAVYEVLEDDLVNMMYECYNWPTSFYGRTDPGFQWLDTTSATVRSVQIEFSIGVECHSEGTIHDTTLNGIPDASFPMTGLYCSCLPGTGAVASIDVDPASYNKGGLNTLLIESATTSVGFVPEPAWGTGVYARITVEYADEYDCNENGIPDDCDIAEGTSLDCNGNDIPDECDIEDGTSEDCNLNGIPDECTEPAVITYTIDADQLVNVPGDCGGGSLFNNCYLEPGFQWDDWVSGEVTSVQIEFNIGVECHGIGTVHDTSLNAIPDTSYTSTVVHCSCDATDGVQVSIDADASSYNIGASNTFLITGPSPLSCLGFIPQPAWGGVYAKITVTYVAEPDCNTNGIPDDCDIAEGTSLDCNGNGVPDECDPHGILYVDDDAPNDPGPGDPTVSDPAEDGSADHPYDAIQEGIDAVSCGATIVDIVEVADGLYTGVGNKNLNYYGQALTVRSANGPDNCIIDCENDGRGFFFDNAETSWSRVDGITIRNGNGLEWHGGAIWCGVTTGPTIDNCVFEDNEALMYGGAIYTNVSWPIIRGCKFYRNDAYLGGGILAQSSWPTIINCTFGENYAVAEGGGISFTMGGTPTVTNCSFTGNTTGQYGAGISCWETTDALIDNCTFTLNQADFDGAAVWSADGTVTVRNSILWGDTAPNGPELSLWGDASSVLTVEYSDVEGGQAGVYIYGDGTLVWGSGNIETIPLFADADGPDNIPGTADDDVRISAGSPCIDAADNTGVPLDTTDLDHDGDTTERTPIDSDGAPRFFDDPATTDTGVPDPPDYMEIVDMGAYEFQGTLGGK